MLVTANRTLVGTVGAGIWESHGDDERWGINEQRDRQVRSTRCDMGHSRQAILPANDWRAQTEEENTWQIRILL
jgi:hypothetical protein